MPAIAEPDQPKTARQPPPGDKTQFAKGHPDSNPLRRQGAYTQACTLQDVVFKSATSDSVAPAVLSSLARAWSELEDRKRILKMKFKPGDLSAADLDPARADWVARKFRKANAKHLGHLPKELFIEAEVLKPKSKALAAPPSAPETPSAPAGPDLLPGDVTP